jgi:uncharacterized protein YbjT (DUF2867 family)
MNDASDRPRLLLVGGSGGLVGRALLPEVQSKFRVRSVHRNPVHSEATAGVEWIQGDIGRIEDWGPILADVDVVVNLAWHRWGNERRFRHLYRGLSRLVESARRCDIPRFLHVSVPPAPPDLERGLPYLSYKRALDRDLASSGLRYRILRPTMLFGRNDRLLGVMLRLMRRYRLFPMFGTGEYHVSPFSVGDLARALALETERFDSGTVDLGGPRRFRYRALTDLMFGILGRRPRYWTISPRSSVALGQLVQDCGSSLLYAYEVEWLMSDQLGLRPYEGLDRPLEPVEPYLRAEAARLVGRRS